MAVKKKAKKKAFRQGVSKAAKKKSAGRRKATVDTATVAHNNPPVNESPLEPTGIDDDPEIDDDYGDPYYDGEDDY